MTCCFVREEKQAFPVRRKREAKLVKLMQEISPIYYDKKRICFNFAFDLWMDILKEYVPS